MEPLSKILPRRPPAEVAEDGDDDEEPVDEDGVPLAFRALLESSGDEEDNDEGKGDEDDEEAPGRDASHDRHTRNKRRAMVLSHSLFSSSLC